MTLIPIEGAAQVPGEGSLGPNLDPRADLAGIEAAAFEMLEQSLGAQIQEALVRRLKEGATEKMLAAYQISRSLPEGYYCWAQHLFLVRRAMQSGMTLRPDLVTAAEMRGVAAVDAALRRFQEEHPPCPHCGRHMDDRHSPGCVHCGAQKGDAAGSR